MKTSNSYPTQGFSQTLWNPDLGLEAHEGDPVPGWLLISSQLPFLLTRRRLVWAPRARPRQRGLAGMAPFSVARAAVLCCWSPVHAGSPEVLLWLFWRASHWDLRWQSPQCTRCLSSNSCFLGCSQAWGFKHTLHRPSCRWLGGGACLSSARESSSTWSLLRRLHISNFSWDLHLSGKLTFAQLFVEWQLALNTFPFSSLCCCLVAHFKGPY